MLNGDPIIDLVQQVSPADLDGELAVNFFEASVDALSSTPLGRLQWLLLSMVDDPHVAAILLRLYREYADVFAAAYERLFGGCGLQPADGMTWAEVAALITAALDGVSIRRSIDPERADRRMAARMFAAVLAGALVPAGDTAAGPVEQLDRLLTAHRPGPHG